MCAFRTSPIIVLTCVAQGCRSLGRHVAFNRRLHQICFNVCLDFVPVVSVNVVNHGKEVLYMLDVCRVIFMQHERFGHVVSIVFAKYLWYI